MVSRDVLPLSLGFIACIWHFKCFFFFFSNTDGSSWAEDMVPSSISEFRLAPSFHCVQLSALLTPRFLLPSLASSLHCSWDWPWTLHLPLLPSKCWDYKCSSLLSLCDKHCDQKQPGEGRAYLTYMSWSQPGQDLKQEQRKEPMTSAADWLVLVLSPLSFTTQDQPQWAVPPTSIINQENAPSTCPQDSLMEVTAQLRSFFLSTCLVCRVDKNSEYGRRLWLRLPLCPQFWLCPCRSEFLLLTRPCAFISHASLRKRFLSEMMGHVKERSSYNVFRKNDSK